MRNFFKAAVGATALGAASFAAVQPAQARDHTGTAIVAGILGLGVGAAIASSNRDHGYRDGYYGQSYGYRPAPVYGYEPAYYGSYYGGDYGYRGDYRRDRRDDRDDRRYWDGYRR